MKYLATFFILTAAVALASPVTQQVTLVNAGVPPVIADSVDIDGKTINGVYIGPYTLQINGNDYAAMCIDFFDESHVGDTWNTYVTQVGSSNLSNTYHPSDAQEYEEDAYLMEQILKPNSNRTGIQEAAWDIMAYGITNSSYKYLIGDNSYIDAALANYGSMNFAGYEIYSDTVQGKNEEQEFLVCTPEPGSFLMLGLGLLFASTAILWRRRSAGAAARA